MAWDYGAGTNGWTFSNPTYFNGLTTMAWFARIEMQSLAAATAILEWRSGGNGFLIFFDDVGSISGRLNCWVWFVENGGSNNRIETSQNSAGTGAYQNIGMNWLANNANGFEAWVDGVEDAQSPASSTGPTQISTMTQNLGVGINGGGTSLSINAKIDEIAIWNITLDDAVHEAMGAGQYSPKHFPNGMIFYARSDRRDPLVNELDGTTATEIGTMSYVDGPAIIDQTQAMIGHNSAAAPSVIARAPQMALTGVGSD